MMFGVEWSKARLRGRPMLEIGSDHHRSADIWTMLAHGRKNRPANGQLSAPQFLTRDYAIFSYAFANSSKTFLSRACAMRQSV
jgi:hypothetical protein